MLPSISSSPPGASANDALVSRRRWLICLGLIVAIAIAYSGVVHNGFVDYDDPDYISNNPNIQHGLNWISLQWAFTTHWAANWHPLTWIALTVDYIFFGSNPVGYHIANVLWHTANSVLLFLWLEYVTRAPWRSATVAAFFALHPFHVESVAWAAERKDVLSTFFWLISVWCYCAYSRHNSDPQPRRAQNFYAASLAAFALGLLAKPMLVTLPCVLFLLDNWPLQRVSPIKRLIIEKIPFLVLSAAASAATVYAQGTAGAMQSLVRLSLATRLENTPVAYVRYLRKTFWPTGLNIFYTYVNNWGIWIISGSIALLCLITIFTFRLRQRRRYLLVGWLWFLGILVPAIGIVQVGEQSMADRYSYLSIVGLFIMVVWTVSDLAISRPWLSRLGAGLSAAALLVCIPCTQLQVATWRDTASLFGHAIEVETDNYLAYYNLGGLIAKLHHNDEAAEYFRRCIQYNPSYRRAYNNLAFLQIDAGQFDSAISNLQKAIELRYLYPEAWMNLGRAYTAKHELPQAKESLEKAINQNPDLLEAYHLLGNVLLKQGAIDQALTNLQITVAVEPRNKTYHLDLANGYIAAQRVNDAVNEYEIALKLDPDLIEACNNLAWILATAPDASFRDGPLAVSLARHAVSLTSGKNVTILGTYAAASAEAGNFIEAARAAEAAQRLALAETNTALAANLSSELNLYRAHQPYRDVHIK